MRITPYSYTTVEQSISHNIKKSNLHTVTKENMDSVELSLNAKKIIQERFPRVTYLNNDIQGWVAKAMKNKSQSYQSAVVIPKALEEKMNNDPELLKKVMEQISKYAMGPYLNENRSAVELDENGDPVLGFMGKVAKNDDADVEKLFKAGFKTLSPQITTRDSTKDEIIVKTFNGNLINISTGEFQGKA